MPNAPRRTCASLTDVNNAFACGETAVRAAIEGKSGFMVKIVRTMHLTAPSNGARISNRWAISPMSNI